MKAEHYLFNAEGFFWAPGKEVAMPPARLHRIATADEAAETIAGLCAEKRVVVQAGGHVGLWPKALATHFEAVYTFEPEHFNFCALAFNCMEDNVYAFRAALGAEPATTGLGNTTGKSGEFFCEGEGNITVIRVDDLGLSNLDALVLDVEGYELAALQGAEKTITRCHPVLWIEYRQNQKAILDYLASIGYDGPFPGLKRDSYFLPVKKGSDAAEARKE